MVKKQQIYIASITRTIQKSGKLRCELSSMGNATKQAVQQKSVSGKWGLQIG